MKNQKSRWFYLVGILAITLLAAWLRLWRLSHVPPGLDYDEAIEGLDALWMLKTGTPYLFVASNHGREALFLYPLALLITLLGATPFTLRLTSALAGILTIPLIYRLVKSLFGCDSQRDWLALLAAAGMATSLWHIGMSRVPLRAILIPPFFALTAYLFWRGWQIQTRTRYPISSKNRLSYAYFAMAGMALGLSQYTYLAARLFPVIFGLTALGAWLTQKLSQKSKLEPDRLQPGNQAHQSSVSLPPHFIASPPLRFSISMYLPAPWLGLLIMGGVSALVFMPMAILFLQNPVAFSGRANEVNFQMQWNVEGIISLARHLAQAFNLFLGGSDPRLRHHLVDRPVFDLLTLLAFWAGVVVAARHWRQPEFLFLLVSVWVLWLPAPLSIDPIHSLRATGLLPAFFILVALGLLRLVLWVVRALSTLIKIPLLAGHRSALRPKEVSNGSLLMPGLVSLGLVTLVIGGLNTYDYFVRWANHPLVYRNEYKGPDIDLARYAANLAETTDVILPYKFYAYAPVRYLLQYSFREELTLPFSPFERQAGGRPIIYLTWLDDLPSPLFVWLTHNEAGHGVAYLTRLQGEADQAQSHPILGSHGDVIGRSQAITEAMLARLYIKNPIVTTPFIWGEHIHLAGYELASPLIIAGEPGVITFYWQGLRDTDLDYKVFIQILNGQGEPISQLEEAVIKESIQYYENRDGFVAQSHLFWTGPDLAAGLYLLRVGLFQPRSGERLPITTLSGQSSGDQIILTPFYVSAGGVDPRLADTSLQVSLGDGIELLGYSPGQPLSQPLSDGLEVKLYWRATRPIADDYTVFVQLLDDQNRVVSQTDAQPLGGLYPTSRWQPDQVLVSRFTLPVNETLSGGAYRLVTGMYLLTTGARLIAFDAQGQPLPDNMIILAQAHLP